MPSIPQSLLWISLVVLWLFVLVPMLINKRDTVRRTSDVALATRVLNSGAKSRLIRRRAPAAGHRHDPDWQHDEEFVGEFVEDYPVEADEFAEQRDVIKEYDDAVREARMGGRVRSVVVVAAVSEQTLSEPDYLDVDIVDENSGALPVGGGVQASLFDPPQEETRRPETVGVDEPRTAAAPPPEPEHVPEPEPAPVAEPAAERTPEPPAEPLDDEYEYIDDTSDFEAEQEAPIPVAHRSASRQRRLETTAAAAVSARKYRFRKRMLTAMVALMVLTAVLSFTVSPTLWWSCGAVAGVLVLYLAYLRRQTRIEEQVRRRRQQRMARSRSFVDAAPPPRMPEVDLEEFPTRLQRPGAVVLEIDDEDPVFEHLEEMAYSGSGYGMPGDLPRASGQ